MLVFSHRGIGFGIEENTMESFQAALDQGFSLEIDVQKSKDGMLVISHDTNLKRMKNIDKNLTDMTGEELNGVIPTLDEFFVMFKQHKQPGQKVALHIKDETQGDILKLTVAAIERNNVENDCFLFEITKEGAEKVKSFNENVQVFLAVGEKKYYDFIHLWDEVVDCKACDGIWWDEWEEGLYTKENAAAIKQTGKPNYVISPELHKVHGHPRGNALEDVVPVWKDLIAWDVEGICTDFPLELRKLLPVQH